MTFPHGMWVYYYFDGTDRPKWIATLMDSSMEITSVVSFRPDSRIAQERQLWARAMITRGIDQYHWGRYHDAA